jgi:beta-lactamase class A
MSLIRPPKQPPQQIVRSVSYPVRTHVGRAYEQPSSSNKFKFASFFVMASLLMVAGFIFGLPGSSHGEVKATTTNSQPEEVKPAPPKKLDFTEMNAVINAEIQKYPSMDIGVAVVDIKTGDSQTYGVNVPFVAASTAKLLTAIAYLHDVEHGTATLSQSVGARSAQEALKAMIIDSDNDAWNAFNNGVMSHSELRQYANTIGLSNYNPDTNTITPDSVALLLSNLYQQKLLNNEHTQLLLSYMLQAKEVDYVTNTVPTGTKVYHKPGYLADRVHDAAIIDNEVRPYVLVIFSKSHTAGYNSASGAALFKQITLATTKNFNQ